MRSAISFPDDALLSSGSACEGERFVSNHSGDDCRGGENFGHDATGAILNGLGLSGAVAKAEGRESCYDYPAWCEDE